MISKFLEEKKFLIKNKINYKFAICCTDFSSLNLKNIFYAEEKLNSNSDKMNFNSINGLYRFAKTLNNIDLIETGNIKIKNIDELKKILTIGNVLCELKLTPTFF